MISSASTEPNKCPWEKKAHGLRVRIGREREHTCGMSTHVNENALGVRVRIGESTFGRECAWRLAQRYFYKAATGVRDSFSYAF